MSEIRSSGRELQVHPDLFLDSAPGWQRAEQLAIPQSPLLREIVEKNAANLSVTLPVAASRIWKRYAYWASFLAVLGWAFNQRVPLIDAQHLWIRFDSQAAHPEIALDEVAVVTLADNPVVGTVVAASQEELLELIQNTLIDKHLAPIAAELHRLTGLSRKVIWASVAMAIVQPLRTLNCFLPTEPLSAANTLLQRVIPEFAHLVDLHPAGTASFKPQRKACCLAYQIPGNDNCSSCPSRVNFVAELLAEPELNRSTSTRQERP